MPLPTIVGEALMNTVMEMLLGFKKENAKSSGETFWLQWMILAPFPVFHAATCTVSR